MAVPTDSNEAFLREVDEELRRDQLGTAWRRYGKLVIGLVIVGLALFGGFLWWQDRQEKARGVAGEEMTSALTAIRAGKNAEAETKLKALAAGDNEGYSAAARLALAARLVEQNDLKGAIAKYGEIASDTALAQPFRDMAMIRGTLLAFDDLKPEQVIARMKPLALPGEPWFGSAGEMTAMALYRAGRRDEAGKMFAVLAADKQVPDSIRARAVRISGALGVDAAVKIAADGKE